tara:strand:+ start:18138 stop:18371 length:234 start_codon:yes stop_codon:yes gene_type:complete
MCIKIFEKCFDVENPIPERANNDMPHYVDLNYHLFPDAGLNRNLFNHINRNINKVKLILLYNTIIIHIGLYYYFKIK